MATNSKLNELIETINHNSNIVDVIKEYIPIEKRGANYWAVCPFHDDTSPSLSISEIKNIFKCFSCGAGGNAISFVQRFKNISFIDALKELSDKYSIDYKKYIILKERKYSSEEKLIFQINQETQYFYQFQLKKEIKTNKALQGYLKKRNITDEIIEKYNIGYAKKDGGLFDFLQKKGFSVEEINQSGLINSNNLDYFRDRLMFTIIEDDGFVYGFSGRKINDSENGIESPKYLNSRENVVFRKNNIIWNIPNIGYKENQLLIFEGFMDVISWEQLSNSNIPAISLMGLGFSQGTLNRLKQRTNKIILGYDKDEAGINNTISVGNRLVQNNINVNVLNFDGGKDIDEHFSSSNSWSEEPYFLWFINKFLLSLTNINNIENYDLIPVKQINDFIASFRNSDQFELMKTTFEQKIVLHKMFFKPTNNDMPPINNDFVGANIQYNNQSAANSNIDYLEIKMKEIEKILFTFEVELVDLIRLKNKGSNQDFIVEIEAHYLSPQAISYFENIKNVEKSELNNILNKIDNNFKMKYEDYSLIEDLILELVERVDELNNEINKIKLLIIKYKNEGTPDNHFHKTTFNKLKKM